MQGHPGSNYHQPTNFMQLVDIDFKTLCGFGERTAILMLNKPLSELNTNISKEENMEQIISNFGEDLKYIFPGKHYKIMRDPIVTTSAANFRLVDAITSRSLLNVFEINRSDVNLYKRKNALVRSPFGLERRHKCEIPQRQILEVTATFTRFLSGHTGLRLDPKYNSGKTAGDISLLNPLRPVFLYNQKHLSINLNSPHHMQLTYNIAWVGRVNGPHGQPLQLPTEFSNSNPEIRQTIDYIVINPGVTPQGFTNN